MLDAVAFDKTGTLTEGEPKVVDIRTGEGIDEQELLRTTIAVEDLSKHPLAKAVVRDGKERLLAIADCTSSSLKDDLIATDLKSITGRGIQAVVEGELVHIGKDDLFEEVEGTPLPDEIRNIAARLEENGRTTMIIRRGNRFRRYRIDGYSARSSKANNIEVERAWY